jgi:hypothetical protein
VLRSGVVFLKRLRRRSAEIWGCVPNAFQEEECRSRIRSSRLNHYDLKGEIDPMVNTPTQTFYENVMDINQLLYSQRIQSWMRWW